MDKEYTNKNKKKKHNYNYKQKKKNKEKYKQYDNSEVTQKKRQVDIKKNVEAEKNIKNEKKEVSSPKVENKASAKSAESFLESSVKEEKSSIDKSVFLYEHADVANCSVPFDPQILKFFVNEKLSLKNASLDSVCNDYNIDKKKLIKDLNNIDYKYNEKTNRFE